MTGRIWPAEALRLAAVATLGLAVGWLSGFPLFGLLAGVVFHLAWTFAQLARLLQWLRAPNSGPLPDADGAWGAVFDGLGALNRRHRERASRLGRVIERYRQATMAMPDAVVILDPRGRIEWFNAAARTLLGLRFPADMDQPVRALVREPAFSDYVSAPGREEPLQIQSPTDERLWLSIRVVSFGDDSRLLLARDVTRVRRLETMRRDFVANVSHELRSPLTVIHGYAESLADDADRLPEPARIPVQRIATQSERMTRIVEQLLQLSRLDTTAPPEALRLVDMTAMIQGLRDHAAGLSDGRHAVNWEIESDLALLGSREELFSAFSNLLSNAIRYTPAGGTITVRWYRDAHGAAFEVADTGPGIAPEHLPRLTERFYRVDEGRSREQGGTGLGLAIVHHVLLRHNARLDIDSRPGAGSTFRCCFPLSLVVMQGPGDGHRLPVAATT